MIIVNKHHELTYNKQTYCFYQEYKQFWTAQIVNSQQLAIASERFSIISVLPILSVIPI